MKKLLVVALLLAAAAFVARSSVYYSVFRLQQGLDRGDLSLVLAYADLKAFATLPVDVAVAVATAETRNVAGALGEDLVKAFGGALGDGIKRAGGRLAEEKLQSHITTRDLEGLGGGFRPNSGLSWFGGVHEAGEARVLTVVGTCPAREDKTRRIEVSVAVSFSPSKGPWGGYPLDWRAMGVEPASLQQAVRDCHLSF
ncbi:MAG: hypothetical protein INH41_13690 [Myxococcaceae bacterium]|nr:hypothetical protein [Myxococcaceae bacterium]MCA3013430.1 hypothetical protein [Myxococcaceae bacterium]